tara:strand:- start:200 stop:418 length:219 start_codon:yes stop_codon:yes gene_type:complete
MIDTDKYEEFLAQDYPRGELERQLWHTTKSLLDEVERTHSEIERLNKMFCVGCGACGTETEYAECTCEGGEE